MKYEIEKPIRSPIGTTHKTGLMWQKSGSPDWIQLRLPPKRAKQMIMQELVIRLFEQEIITSAQGAYLLKMNRLEFERFLADHEIPIHGEADELREDILNLSGEGN